MFSRHRTYFAPFGLQFLEGIVRLSGLLGGGCQQLNLFDYGLLLGQVLGTLLLLFSHELSTALANLLHSFLDRFFCGIEFGLICLGISTSINKSLLGSQDFRLVIFIIKLFQ